MDSLEIITLSEANYKTLLGKRIQIIELPSDESTIPKVEAKNKSEDELMTVALVNVGYHLNLMGDEYHKSICQSAGYTKPPKGTDGSDYEERYLLTRLG